MQKDIKAWIFIARNKRQHYEKYFKQYLESFIIMKNYNFLKKITNLYSLARLIG